MNPQKHIAYINISGSESTRNRRVSRFTPSSGNPEDDNKSTKHVPKRSSTELKKSGGSAQATPEKGAPFRPAKPTSRSKWKSSFTPINRKNPGNNLEEQNSEEKPDLYDPFDGPENSSSDGSENPDWQRSLQDRKYRADPSGRPSFSRENRQYSEHHRIERSKEEEMNMLDYRPTVQRVQLYSPALQRDYEMKEPPKADPGTRRVSRFSQEPPSRVSRDLKESIIDIARRATAEPVISDVSVKAMQAESPQTAQSSIGLSQWKSLKPLDQKDTEDDSPKKNSEKRAELYKPFDKAEKASSGDGENAGWDGGYLDYRVLPQWETEAAHERHNFDTGRLAERRSYSPDRDGSGRRSFSPDSRRYSEIYRRERSKEEQIIISDHQDYEMESEPVRAEPDYSWPGNLLKRARRTSVQMDKITINCDLCDIEVSDGQELEKHLESKSHWDTMENIQEQNNYNDMAIAFLQDVMQYKSIKSSRPVDYSLLQGLQENDHMTKVSLFNCAACQVLVSTAAAAVQNHISSPEHIANTKEFDAQRSQASLNKADAIMKEMQPQFANFMRGFNHF
ncbi:uncharacterized protein LOC144085624 isoform X2 [Stigmatopora argus]